MNLEDFRIPAIVLPALAFAFMNGANDSGTMSASLVSSRTLTPRRAALIAAICAFGGSMILGSAVAHTIGENLVRLKVVPPGNGAFSAVSAAAVSALGWCLVAYFLKLPGSYTHALLGGWLGAFMGLGGAGVVQWGNAAVVLLGVLATPVIGLVASWIGIRTFYRVFGEFSLRTLPLFRGIETATFAGLCVAHGANAAQKSMALIMIAALSLGRWPPEPSFNLPFWIRLVCSLAFALGVLLGFTGTLKTMGFGIFRVGPIHSVCALGVSSFLILVSTLAGLPLSPGQINSSCLLGVGAGENMRRVRWDVAGGVLENWFLTFPATALLSYLIVKVIS